MLGSRRRRLDREAAMLGLPTPLSCKELHRCYRDVRSAVTDGGAVEWWWLMDKNLKVGWGGLGYMFVQMK